MDKAKAAVTDFMHKSGHKDTTVHETVNPAITKETVTPTRHDETQLAVDKEVHQDHYHTSVQPVKDSQVLPEQHTHHVAPVQKREVHHGNTSDDKARVADQTAQFRDERTVTDTQHSQSTAPALAGEHVHHHVHETIQPVVHKQTIQPQVVHTTQPVHEVHHNAALHHGTHELPPVSKSDLESKGVSLTGRDERVESFAGEPKPLSGHSGATATSTSTSHSGLTGTTGTTGRTTGTTGTTGMTGTTGTTGSSTGNPPGYSSDKPSLMDKMNPKVDSTGDGKAGFMK